MIQVSNTIEIARPPAQVFAYVANFENNPNWMPVNRVQNVTNGAVGKGTRFKQQVDLFGASYEVESVITELVPNERIAFEYNAPIFNWRGSYLFEPSGAGTRVTAKGSVTLTGPYKMAEPMFAPKLRRLINDTAPKLKQVLEK